MSERARQIGRSALDLGAQCELMWDEYHLLDGKLELPAKDARPLASVWSNESTSAYCSVHNATGT